MFSKLMIFLLLPAFSFAQNADWKELQGKIDSAVKSSGVVYIKRNYTIDKPLVIADWNGQDYVTVSIKLSGKATMWDNMNQSVIRATFNDAPILCIQKNKGTTISGITFRGPGVDGRDSRYSPAACIAIDPFSNKVPADGGYPKLNGWYRGRSSTGSKGVRIEDCTVKDMVIGIIVSPNGQTGDADQLNFENIRFGNCKYGFVGCQVQENKNKLVNVACWEKSETLFVWNKYGAKQAGGYIIDGVNIAGGVKSIVNRHSTEKMQLTITNVYAESVDSIGNWTSTTGTDILSKASIGFNQSSVTDNQLDGAGLTINHSNIRYYGQPRRLLFRCKDCKIKDGVINALNAPSAKGTGKTFEVKLTNGLLKMKLQGKVGNSLIFVKNGTEFIGTGVIEKVIGDEVILKVSPSIKNGEKYSIAD